VAGYNPAKAAGEVIGCSHSDKPIYNIGKSLVMPDQPADAWSSLHAQQMPVPCGYLFLECCVNIRF
jgi:hypothetical protein